MAEHGGMLQFAVLQNAASTGMYAIENVCFFKIKNKNYIIQYIPGSIFTTLNNAQPTSYYYYFIKDAIFS